MDRRFPNLTQSNMEQESVVSFRRRCDSGNIIQSSDAIVGVSELAYKYNVTMRARRRDLEMTRKKVKLSFISNDSARKATFKKRKKGLMKKVSELSTLCGIDACVIIYSPYDSQPEVWPSDGEVRRVVGQFKKMPEMEQSKKMVNQESFLRQRIAKAQEILKKQRKENREKEIRRLMFDCLTGAKDVNSLSTAELNETRWLVDSMLKDVNKRIELLKKDADDHNNITHTVNPAAGGGAAAAEDAFAERGWEKEEPWFMDFGFGGGGGDDVILPLADPNLDSLYLWSNAFFP